MNVGKFTVSEYRIAREKQGLSMSRLCEETGINLGLMSRIETGKKKASARIRTLMTDRVGGGDFFNPDGTIKMREFVTYEVKESIM